MVVQSSNHALSVSVRQVVKDRHSSISDFFGKPLFELRQLIRRHQPALVDLRSARFMSNSTSSSPRHPLVTFLAYPQALPPYHQDRANRTDLAEAASLRPS